MIKIQGSIRFCAANGIHYKDSHKIIEFKRIKIGKVNEWSLIMKPLINDIYTDLTINEHNDIQEKIA